MFLCVQPSQLEKATSNPDIYGSHARQKWVDIFKKRIIKMVHCGHKTTDIYSILSLDDPEMKWNFFSQDVKQTKQPKV